MARNGLQEAYWKEGLSRKEQQAFLLLFAQTDASFRLLHAGTDADGPNRDRAAGCLVALASGAGGGLPDAGLRAQAVALLEGMVKRAPQAETVEQEPREARG